MTQQSCEFARSPSVGAKFNIALTRKKSTFIFNAARTENRDRLHFNRALTLHQIRIAANKRATPKREMCLKLLCAEASDCQFIRLCNLTLAAFKQVSHQS